ncbi:MAG: NAD(+) synthase, partial [archaeon]
IESLVNFIKKETTYYDWSAKANEYEKHYGAVIGLSGGLDSAVVAALAVKALGKEKVYAVLMPSNLSTSKGIDVDYAKKQAEALGIKYDIVPIGGIVDAYLSANKDFFKTKTQNENVQSRARMPILYDRAWSTNSLVFGTSNLSEFMTGYFTKFGDGAADIEPIITLYKTQVRQISKEIGVLEEIINRVPTAGLSEGQTDESALEVDYATLDKILLGRELGMDIWALEHNVPSLKDSPVAKVFKRIEKNAHKRKLAPVPEPKFRDIVVELLNSQGRIKGSREDYFSSLDEYDKVLDKLITKEDFKKHIWGILNDERNDFGWYNQRDDRPEHEIYNIYDFLADAARRFPAELGSRLEGFYDAVIEIVTDKEKFFRKEQFGSPGTPGEYTGPPFVSMMRYHLGSNRDKDRNLYEGKVAKQLLPHINLDDVLSGKLQKGTPEYMHQIYLLGLLYTAKTYEVPGKEFWKKLRAAGLMGKEEDE